MFLWDALTGASVVEQGSNACNLSSSLTDRQYHLLIYLQDGEWDPLPMHMTVRASLLPHLMLSSAGGVTGGVTGVCTSGVRSQLSNLAYLLGRNVLQVLTLPQPAVTCMF